MKTKDEIVGLVRGFVMQQFPLARQRGIRDDDSLAANGIIDSLGVLDVVGFIEETFGIQLTDEERLSENFETIAALGALIADKLNNETSAWTS